MQEQFQRQFRPRDRYCPLPGLARHMIHRAQSYPSKEGQPGSRKKGPKHKTIDIELCQLTAVRLLQMWSKENHFQSILQKNREFCDYDVFYIS